MNKTATKLQRICSWCKKDMDTGRQLTDTEYKELSKVATHGMCPECLEKETATPPDAHKFSMNNDKTLGGVSGGAFPKERQLDLFSGLRANILIATCQTCFRKFTGNEMGKDGRYCKECEGNLNTEWQFMKDRGVKIKPGWVPKLNGEAHHKRHKKNGTNGHATPIEELPIKKIKDMATKGMSSKRIAAELIKKGFNINYRTIARMVKGSGSNDRTRQGTKAKRLPATSKAKPRRVSARR